MTYFNREELRIKKVYAGRDAVGKPSLYSWHRQEVLLNQYRFRALAASMLKASGFTDLSRIHALDVGCGTGGWLRTLLEWGASSECLHGIDLLQDRIDKAKNLGGGLITRLPADMKSHSLMAVWILFLRTLFFLPFWMDRIEKPFLKR